MSLRYMSFAILLVLAVCVNAPAHAGYHYVASYGTDSGNCTRTAPCATVSKALSNAAVNDTILCEDAIVDYGLLITRSIDIDCSAGRVVVRDVGYNGALIYINIPASSGGDLSRTVRLRGISLNGAYQSTQFTPTGIHILSAAVVEVENVVVSDMAQQGIFDERTGGQTKLFITDSIIRNNAGVGIAIGSQGPATIVLDNVRSENNAYGVAAASGNSLMINRSVISGNSIVGVEGDTGAQIAINNSTISHNNVGVQSNQSIRLSNNDIAFNNTAISGGTGSFGNNRLSGNGTTGTNLIPLGGASPDVAQQ